ncbi:MAG: lysozyme [Thermoleophilaceae bacterium]|jgi:GH25 family lysozyme M1 (1,4-beta-N-acetylmuramidase)|nr:lysozyme [Thermoleophilaceae bacterium]
MARPPRILAVALCAGGLTACGTPAPAGPATSAAPAGHLPKPAALVTGSRGVNVSSAQGTIDWSQVAGSDIRFALVRASDGSQADPDFQRNYDDARANGLRAGAYHRIEPQPGSSSARDAQAQKEAKVFVAAVGKRSKPGDIIPTVDVEPPFGGLTEPQVVQYVALWTSEVEKALGVKAMIYTDADEWRQYAGDSGAAAADGHPLWIADLENAPPALPAGNWGGRGWAFWQRIEREDIPGIHTIVDVNVFGLKKPGPVLLKGRASE